MLIVNNTVYIVSLLEKEPVTTLIYGYNDEICYVIACHRDLKTS